MSQLFKVTSWIADSKIALVLVKGEKHVGKTRFIKRIATLFYQRNKFPFKISYKDLKSI